MSELSNKTGLSKSSLSNIENNINNPTIDNLEKICKALSVLTTDVISFLNRELTEENILNEDIEKNIQEFIINKYKNINCNSNNSIPSFNTAEEAMSFILSQPTIMGYGGFDMNKMNDKDKIEFANDLLAQIELLSYKYGMKNRK